MNPGAPFPRPTACALGLALVVLWLLARAAGAEADRVELAGSWFVLVHYRDSTAADPEADHWEDKVWTFEREGSRLRWIEYPIVVFEDEQGRFGSAGGTPNARFLHAWEPNEAQKLEISRGVQVNPRGSKSKSLEGSAERGYRSNKRARPASAITIEYQEIWSIDNPTEKPVFTRDDRMGTGAALATGDQERSLSGRTRYATLEVSNDGDLLTGTYSRDENRVGTFRMVRAGAPRPLQTDGRSLPRR